VVEQIEEWSESSTVANRTQRSSNRDERFSVSPRTDPRRQQRDRDRAANPPESERGSLASVLVALARDVLDVRRGADASLGQRLRDERAHISSDKEFRQRLIDSVELQPRQDCDQTSELIVARAVDGDNERVRGVDGQGAACQVRDERALADLALDPIVNV
jgi:hypothetical protein